MVYVAFAVFEDDSTIGMIRAFWFAAQGDYSHFVQYWTVGDELLWLPQLIGEATYNLMTYIY